MRTSERKHNYVSEERLAERPPGVVARRAAACMVRHHCKAFWLCLVLMAAATCGVILPGGFPGRFKFRSSYSFEMYIAGDPLTDHGDAIYQIERRPQDMLAHLRGERVVPRDHVVAKEEENFGRPWRQRRRLSEATPPPPPPETCAPICCEAMTASCLACKECKTVDEWCAANPSTEWPGCESAVEAPTAGPATEELQTSLPLVSSAVMVSFTATGAVSEAEKEKIATAFKREVQKKYRSRLKVSLEGGDLLHGGRTLEPLLQVSFTDLTADEAEELQARLNALLATKKATNEFLEKHDLGDIDAEAKPTVQMGVTSPSPPPTPPATEELETSAPPAAVVGDELDANAAGLTAEAPVDGGAIAGVVIGVLAVVLIAVGAGVVVVWRRRRQELPSTIVSVDPIEAKKLSV